MRAYRLNYFFVLLAKVLRGNRLISVQLPVRDFATWRADFRAQEYLL